MRSASGSASTRAGRCVTRPRWAPSTSRSSQCGATSAAAGTSSPRAPSAAPSRATRTLGLYCGRQARPPHGGRPRPGGTPGGRPPRPRRRQQSARGRRRRSRASRGEPGAGRASGHGQEPDDRQPDRRVPGGREDRPVRQREGGGPGGRPPAACTPGRGLGDFCLECHSHKANRAEVVPKSWARCLDLPPVQQGDHAEDLRLLEEARGELERVRPGNARTPRAAGQILSFEVQGECGAALPPAEVSRSGRSRACRVATRTLPAACHGPSRGSGRLRRRDCRPRPAPLAWLPSRRKLLADLPRRVRATTSARLAAGLASATEAAGALRGLGFCEAERHRRAVDPFGEGGAREVLACPAVPPNGSGPTRGRRRRAVIQLDDASRDCLRRLGSLQEFSRDALTGAAPDALASITSALRELGTVKARKGDTLRSLGQRLAVIREARFVAARGRADEAERRERVVAGLLRVPPSFGLVKGLTRLEELAALLSRIGSQCALLVERGAAQGADRRVHPLPGAAPRRRPEPGRAVRTPVARGFLAGERGGRRGRGQFRLVLLQDGGRGGRSGRGRQCGTAARPPTWPTSSPTWRRSPPTTGPWGECRQGAGALCRRPFDGRGRGAGLGRNARASLRAVGRLA